MTVHLIQGDARQIPLPDASIDAIVCDPPYELGFMGKDWDASGVAYQVDTWAQALNVLKPGGHLLAFGSPRTFHRLTYTIEDAGFEIRDCVVWLYGSGFPKSLNLGDGYGTALKPAWEPIVLARKPLAGTVAQNVLEHGIGVLNIEGCRIITDDKWDSSTRGPSNSIGTFRTDTRTTEQHPEGRWPANVLLDEEAAALLDAETGELTTHAGTYRADSGAHGLYELGVARQAGSTVSTGDRGGPSRFFYTAKASRSEREAGLDALEPARRSDGRAKDIENPRLRTSERRNDHPTVKPLDLMRWLVRLVTPPGGLILDPFMGSGTTGMAALDEGCRFIGLDQERHYVEIARQRIAHRHLLDIATTPSTAEMMQGQLF